MSGEKPPETRFGTARNQGRRDNIRAGSVSGPWRSGPAPSSGRRPQGVEPIPEDDPVQQYRAREAREPPPRLRWMPRSPLGLTLLVLGAAVVLFLLGIAARIGGAGNEPPAPGTEEAAPAPTAPDSPPGATGTAPSDD